MFVSLRSALLVLAAASASSVAPAQVGPVSSEPLIPATTASMPKIVVPEPISNPALTPAWPCRTVLEELLQAAGDQPVKVATVGFTPPTYNVGWSSGYPIPNVHKIRSTVHRLTHQAAVTPATGADPDGLGAATTTTRAPSGSGSAPAKRKPACGTVG